MSRLPALLLAACLLLLAGACSTPQRTQPAGATLRVVTLNIYHDKADWPKRLPLIVAGLRELQPDVVVLQEVLQTAELPNQARTIADALGYGVQFVSTDPEDRAHRYGNAILTRHPVPHSDGRPLEPLDDSRTVAHARIASAAGVVEVYATHLHWTGGGGAIRERQVRDLLRYVAGTRSEAPVIIAGDFNAPADAPEFAALVAGHVDAYAARHPGADRDADAHTTLNPAFFAHRSRIDHVFVERGRFEVVEAHRILDVAGADGTWPSDHFGVSVDLRILP